MAADGHLQAVRRLEELSQPFPNDLVIYEGHLNHVRQKLDNTLQNQDGLMDATARRAVLFYNELENLEESLLTIRKDPSVAGIEGVWRRLQHQLQHVEIAILKTSLQVPLIHNDYKEHLPFETTADARPRLQLQSTYNAPLLSSSRLIGRDAILSELRKAVIRKNHNHNIVSLCGMRGSGKTTIIRSFIDSYAVKDEFKTVIWADGHSLKTIEHQYSKIATKISRRFSRFATPQSKIDFLLSTITEGNEPTLFVLDNFNNTIDHERLIEYLPRNGRYTLLILKATFQASFPEHDEIRLILPALSVEDSIQILFETVRKDPYTSDTDLIRRYVVEKLGCNPLSIKSAGRFLSDSDFSFQQFASKFDKFYPLVYRGRKAQNEQCRALITMWCISLGNLAPQNPAFADHIRQMLLFCTFIYPAEINGSFGSLLFTSASSQPAWAKHYSSATEWRPELFERMISYLNKHTLLDIDSSRDQAVQFTLHPYIRQWLWDREDPQRLVQHLVLAIDHVLKRLELYKDQSSARDIRSYLRMYSKSLLSSLTKVESMEECQEFLEQYSRFLLAGKYTLISYIQNNLEPNDDEGLVDYISIVEECFQRHQGLLGPSHPSSIDLGNRLGDLYTKEGYHVRAEAILRQCLRRSKKRMSTHLAICLYQQGKTQEAGQAHNNLATNWSTGHLTTSDYLRYIEQRTINTILSGSLSQASDLLLAVEEVEPENINQSVVKARIYLHLSNLYWTKSRRINSVKLQSKGVELLEDALSSSNEQYLTAVQDLGQMHAVLQDWINCKELYSKIIKAYEICDGPYSQKTNDARHSQAHAMMELDEIDEGIAAHNSALDNLLLGTDINTETTKEIFYCLAQHYETHSANQDLLQLHTRITSRFHEDLSPRTPFQRTLQHNLIKLYSQQDNWQEAETLLNDLTNPHANTTTTPTPQTLTADLNILAIILRIQGLHHAAEHTYRRLLYLECNNATTPSVATLSSVMLDLIQVLRQQGKSEDARNLGAIYIQTRSQTQNQNQNQNQNQIPALLLRDLRAGFAVEPTTERRGAPPDNHDEEGTTPERALSAWDSDASSDPEAEDEDEDEGVYVL